MIFLESEQLNGAKGRWWFRSVMRRLFGPRTDVIWDTRLEDTVWRPGMVLLVPENGKSHWLSAGFYLVLSDPAGPVVQLCHMERDTEGFPQASHRQVYIERAELNDLQPIIGYTAHD